MSALAQEPQQSSGAVADEISRKIEAIVGSPGSSSRRRLWRRMAIAFVIVLLLHLLFFLVIAPNLEMFKEAPERTEVTEISPQQLEQLKKQINARHLNPLTENEIHKEFQTKEAPKDAKMMGPINQVVPKEMIAGAQNDVPLNGGGGGGRSSTRERSDTKPHEQLNLAKLGLGTTLPKPVPQEEQAPAGPPGPNGPFRPMGREDKTLEHGDQNMLNAAESKFYSFFARLEEPIIRNWFFYLRSNDSTILSEMQSHGVREGADLPVSIEFVLDQQGNFKSITVVESSGIPTLDRVTRDAVAKLGSLPNPPPDLFENGQYFTHVLRFMVHVTNTPMVNNRPDLAW